MVPPTTTVLHPDQTFISCAALDHSCRLRRHFLRRSRFRRIIRLGQRCEGRCHRAARQPNAWPDCSIPAHTCCAPRRIR